MPEAPQQDEKYTTNFQRRGRYSRRANSIREKKKKKRKRGKKIKHKERHVQESWNEENGWMKRTE